VVHGLNRNCTRLWINYLGLASVLVQRSKESVTMGELDHVVKINGKTLNCVECGNFGKKGGCEVCFRVKSKIRIKLEIQYATARHWASLTVEQRRQIKRDEASLRAAIEKAKELQSQIDGREEFLTSIWEAMKKFNMASTRCEKLDATLLKLYGPWV